MKILMFLKGFLIGFSPQMAPCCLVPPASLAEAGRDLFGSTVTPSRPPVRGSAKLVCRQSPVSQMLNGCQKKELLLDQIQVMRCFYGSWIKHKLESGVKPVWSDCAGALELWELAEDERLLVNRFTKHDHDHIVTTVSPMAGANTAVTGSMDCRLNLFYIDIYTPFHVSLQIRSMLIASVSMLA